MSSRAEEYKKSIIKSHELSLNPEDLNLLSSQLDLLITYVRFDEGSKEVPHPMSRPSTTPTVNG